MWLTNHLVHLFKNNPLPILDNLIYPIERKVGQVHKVKGMGVKYGIRNYSSV